jgi:hypothetical protein
MIEFATEDAFSGLHDIFVFLQSCLGLMGGCTLIGIGWFSIVRESNHKEQSSPFRRVVVFLSPLFDLKSV